MGEREHVFKSLNLTIGHRISGRVTQSIRSDMGNCNVRHARTSFADLEVQWLTRASSVFNTHYGNASTPKYLNDFCRVDLNEFAGCILTDVLKLILCVGADI